jgi:uncharacterized protein with NAD-binding domain and iron-sulfur cluster
LVAILGGGVAGLSAAHELVERGFDVTVCEARDIPGGKARSLPVKGSGTDGRRDLPAEHGFRFFPGFYRHLPDTMRRIPVPGQNGGVADNLVAAERVLVAQAGGRNELISAAHAPSSFDDLALVTSFLLEWTTRLGIPPHRHVLFMERLLTLLTSCDERRYGQWEHQSWWEYTDAERRSVAFQKFLADGLTRTLVAARAREMRRAPAARFCCRSCSTSRVRAGARTGCSTPRPTTPGSPPGSSTSPPRGSTSVCPARCSESTSAPDASGA